MNMLDRVFIVSNKQESDTVLSDLMKGISDGGIEAKTIISNKLKGDILSGDSLKEFALVTKKDWKCKKN